MIVTRKQLREAEHERARLQTGWIREAAGDRAWHRLDFAGAVGVTICGLVIGDGGRGLTSGAGALVCDRCKAVLS